VSAYPLLVSIEADRCQGHARCWEICPEVFALDDEGLAYVVAPEVPAELEAKAREAADNCPERAISLA
jgi:ferredoxin